MDKEMLSIGEAALSLGVSVDTLRRWDAAGKFKPAFVSPGKHRFYRKSDIALFMNDLFAVAELWASSTVPDKPSDTFYCALKPTFQTRLEGLQTELLAIPEFVETYSLIVSAVAEIGNNSFDHNLGNWPDVQGIFFGYDVRKRQIVLADRGRGILTTLRVVRPQLADHAEALKVALTEVLTGRAPENRGNGLKYVRAVVAESSVKLTFTTGDAQARIVRGVDAPTISTADTPVQGCVALISF